MAPVADPEAEPVTLEVLAARSRWENHASHDAILGVRGDRSMIADAVVAVSMNTVVPDG